MEKYKTIPFELGQSNHSVHVVTQLTFGQYKPA